MKHMLRHTPCVDEGYVYILNHEDVAALKLHQTQRKDLWDQIKLNGDTE